MERPPLGGRPEADAPPGFGKVGCVQQIGASVAPPPALPDACVCSEVFGHEVVVHSRPLKRGGEAMAAAAGGALNFDELQHEFRGRNYRQEYGNGENLSFVLTSSSPFEGCCGTVGNQLKG